MHVTTHLLMANILYKEITSQMGIQLDYMHYVYGNIKPDFNPGDMDWGHYLKDSFNGVVSYCEHTQKTPMSIKAFSKALGMISHFVCDYYCLYHTEAYKNKSLAVHTLYEHFLELHFIKKCITKDIEVTDEVLGEKIEDIIMRRCDLYQHEAHSIDKDIRYALNTALCVVRRVIELSTVQNSQTADMQMGYEF